MPAPLPDMDAARIAARERRAGLLAGAALALVAIAVVAFALSALGGAPGGGKQRATASAPAQPGPAPLAAGEDTLAPVRGTSRAAASARPAGASPGSVDRIPMTADSGRLFLPLYRRAARAFGVDWRLIASIHQQETSFSSAPGTYRGLNFARCCAGPMQFNVTNGPVTTWERFRNAFRRAARPASYPHRTRRHPSVYDDFDAIMAAGALLRSNGAGRELDGSAWLASYHYYGHDLTGLQYADNVLARAVGWSRSGLCVHCSVDAGLAARFDAAFAAPYRAELVAAERRARAAARAKARGARAARAQARQASAARRRAARLAAERRARARDGAAKKAETTQRKARRQSSKTSTRAPAPAPEASAAAAGAGG